MKDKRILQNLGSSVLIYGFLLLFSIVTSRFILIGYGSEVNGLLSSINQVFAYIALLEAGIGTATVSALYQPLADQNTVEVGDVLAASKAYYRTSAGWYLVCVIIVSFVWPLLVETTISYWTIWGVIFFQGVSGVVTFCYTSAIVNYLTASGSNYVNNHVHVTATLVSYTLKVVICLTQRSIVYISVSLVVINVGKCLFYRRYMKRHCPEYFVRRRADLTLLKQRNSFLVHEISGVIFASTDTIIISIFCGLKEASVYAVYALVLSALRTIIGQAFNGTKYVLGKRYMEDRNGYWQIHDAYNRIYICVVFAVFTVAYILLIPFISLYVSGVTDANYLDEKLPLLFVGIELLSSCRVVDNELIKIALHARKTISRTITEAVINLGTSLVLVQFMGIYGVLCGTILALLYRSNDIILYTNHAILKRSAKNEYVLYALNFLVFAGFMCLAKEHEIAVETYTHLFLWAIVIFVVVTLGYVLSNLVMGWVFRSFLFGCGDRK